MSEDMLWCTLWIVVTICLTVLCCTLANNYIAMIEMYTSNGYVQINDVTTSIHWVK